MKDILRKAAVPFVVAALIGSTVAAAGAQGMATQSPFQWSAPNNNLGTLTIHQGETINESVSFTSNLNLNNVQVVRGSADPAGDRGVAFTVVAPAASLSAIAAHTTTAVTLAIHAQPWASLGLHTEQVYIKTGLNGGASFHQGADLDFRVNVIRAVAPLIVWSAPHNNLGMLTIHRGETINESVSFTSDLNVTNVQVVRGSADPAGDRGVAFTVVAPSASLPAVAAQATTTVMLAIHAQLWASMGLHGEQVYVKTGVAGGASFHRAADLHFMVNVVRTVPARISWLAPDNSLGTLTIHRGTTMYKTVWFRSDQALTNVQVMRGKFDRLGDRGVYASTVSPSAALLSLAAHSQMAVRLAIHVQATAALGLHGEQVYVKAGQFGAPAVHLEGDLDFRVNVVT